MAVPQNKNLSILIERLLDQLSIKNTAAEDAIFAIPQAFYEKKPRKLLNDDSFKIFNAHLLCSMEVDYMKKHYCGNECHKVQIAGFLENVYFPGKKVYGEGYVNVAKTNWKFIDVNELIDDFFPNLKRLDIYKNSKTSIPTIEDVEFFSNKSSSIGQKLSYDPKFKGQMMFGFDLLTQASDSTGTYHLVFVTSFFFDKTGSGNPWRLEASDMNMKVIYYIDLPNLKELNLSRNRLCELPNISQVMSLKELDIMENYFSNILPLKELDLVNLNYDLDPEMVNLISSKANKILDYDKKSLIVTHLTKDS